MSQLKDLILTLPDPILVTGHKAPDADSLSAIKALLNYCKTIGKKAFTAAPIPGIPKYIDWVLEPEDIGAGECQSALVVDCLPTEERLGFPLESVPTIVIDHHVGSAKHQKNWTVFSKMTSSAGCLLIEHGILDPILYVGIWGDTNGFQYYNYPGSESVFSYVDQLVRAGLTGDEIIAYTYKLQTKFNPAALEQFKYGTLYKTVIEKDGQDFNFLLVTTRSAVPEDDRAVLNVLESFADIWCVLNTQTNKGSLRCRLGGEVFDIVNDMNIGAGHPRAVGFVLKIKSPKFKIFYDKCVDELKKMAGHKPGEEVHFKEGYKNIIR